MNEDIHWMRLALDEARKGIGRTAPNPPVGAVLVKNDSLLGKGWHRAAGQPHAEREALAAAIRKFGNDALRGSTAYITLEPCSTEGRTPPCTSGLIDAGVARVVYACVDRNPNHAGRADSLLESAGISVTSGVCADEASPMLRPFFKVRETGLPWVIWKSAMSLDGRITRPPGEGQWLTGEPARADVQKLRSMVDAILTSGETVRRDKPALTIRSQELLEGRLQPWRVVVSDRPESLPLDSPCFTDDSRERTLVRPSRDLPGILRGLASEQGVLTVMIEAGGIFSAAMLEAGLVDEVCIYYAPLLCGGPSPALAGAGLRESLKLQQIDFLQLGNDIRLRGLVDRGEPGC
jgi:diaminohydroxyphosphoribosylaminopyrimidine deaminase/5-amino-6-(5-phosphoribosylamino)uracil reductase